VVCCGSEVFRIDLGVMLFVGPFGSSGPAIIKACIKAACEVLSEAVNRPVWNPEAMRTRQSRVRWIANGTSSFSHGKSFIPQLVMFSFSAMYVLRSIILHTLITALSTGVTDIGVLVAASGAVALLTYLLSITTFKALEERVANIFIS
jgi:hypothetical protein